ncbi:MAG: DUF4038 domain-containing protein [Spirochaetales bacterium]|nr:DUF4038 domain-containing protein [Spirochaetales bacterium]
MKTVTLNKPYDITLGSAGEEQSAPLTGTFVHKEKGTKLLLKGFEQEPGQQTIRYSLPEEGEWDFTITGSAGELETGSVICAIDSETRYPVDVTSYKARPIFTQNDKPYFMSMYECNWLFALWMDNEEDARNFLINIKENRFNSIAMNVYAHTCAWTKEGTPGRLVPPPLFNWGGSNEHPDFSCINPEFYKRFDDLMHFMYDLDLVAHLYYFVWNKGNSYPAEGSPEEAEYVSYITRRYQAFPNVIWDYCKEAYLRINKDHIRTIVKQIKTEDSYNRLITVHDDKLVQYDESFDELLDFYTMQLKHDYYSKTLREIEKGKKPVFCAEYTYESGKTLDDKTFESSHTYENLMRVTWELAIAGSPICYYYTFSSWDVIRVNDRPRGLEGSKLLVDYFNSFDWWNFTARSEENLQVRTQQACAKHIDRNEYMLLTDTAGRFGFTLDFDKYKVEGEWVDIYTGARQAIESSHFVHEYNSQIKFAMCPFAPRHGAMGNCFARFTITER